MSNRLCKTSCWAPRICSPSVLTSDYENTIFPVAQAPKPWSHLWLLSSLHTQHLLNPEILLALTLKHIQNPTMSPILHCCYSCPSCHHFSSDDVKNLPAATLVLSTAFNPEKDSFFKYLSLVITMHRIVRPITCQALQGLTWSGPITSLTSFPTTLPIIHTTLHSTQPAVLNTPFMLLFQGFLSCIPSVGNLLALDTSWFMAHGSLFHFLQVLAHTPFIVLGDRLIKTYNPTLSPGTPQSPSPAMFFSTVIITFWQTTGFQ